MDKTSLGDRIKKRYENRTRFYLPRRTYTIIRLDGRSFHTYTKSCKKPFDMAFNRDMENATMNMFREIQGAQFAYVQSDEISILMTDFEKDGTEAWFDGNIQKITSVSAALMSVHFNAERNWRAERSYGTWARGTTDGKVPAWVTQFPVFDSRVFTVPDRTEVENYFIWRQKDWTRNSVNMLAREHFSHKELMNKSVSDVHEMLHTKDVNWANLDTGLKNGRIIRGRSCGTTCASAPIFTQNRKFFDEVIPRYNEGNETTNY